MQFKQLLCSANTITSPEKGEVMIKAYNKAGLFIGLLILNVARWISIAFAGIWLLRLHCGILPAIITICRCITDRHISIPYATRGITAVTYLFTTRCRIACS